MTYNDLTGRRFGKLTVINCSKKNRYGIYWWNCLCECGTGLEVVGSRLKRGEVNGCKDCRNSHPVIGSKFGKITILEVLGIGKDLGLKGKGRIVKGQCDCGGFWIGPLYALKRGNTKSCGCLPTGVIPNPNRAQPAINKVLSGYKRHALRRGHSWELSNQDFYNLIQGDCYYCGKPPSNVLCPNKSREGGRRRKTISRVVYNGLDRKDNNLGYTLNNTVSCCAVCNYGKRALSSDDFLAHIRKIYLKHFKYE
jgi:hypothetical protein